MLIIHSAFKKLAHITASILLNHPMVFETFHTTLLVETMWSDRRKCGANFVEHSCLRRTCVNENMAS